jgi:hypothetical protein
MSEGLLIYFERTSLKQCFNIIKESYEVTYQNSHDTAKEIHHTDHEASMGFTER